MPAIGIPGLESQGSIIGSGCLRRGPHALPFPNGSAIAYNPLPFPKDSLVEKPDISYLPEEQQGSKDQNTVIAISLWSMWDLCL